jgi:hypothetical protein
MASLENITQEDLDKMEAALDKYKKENEKFRTQRDEFKSMAENNEANAKLRERLLQTEAKARLASTGAKDAERFAKYIDFSKVGVDEEDNIVGLDDQIEAIKSDFVEVFDPKRRVGGMADAGDKNPADLKTKTTTDMQLDAIFGNR